MSDNQEITSFSEVSDDSFDDINSSKSVKGSYIAKCYNYLKQLVGDGKGGAMGLKPHLILGCSIGF